ncbi:lysophospholipase [Xylariaceae sp. FL1272]|nr:lysophospholipase [Xylariaceae sp. FL1272]
MRVTQASLPLPLLSLVSAVLAAPGSSGSGLDAITALEILRRAAPDSPSGTYAPATVDCPSDQPTVRGAGSLSTSETDWLKKRRANTVQPMIDFLDRANISGFDAGAWVQSHSNNYSVVPNIGVAVSGGGYRALMNGAGFLAAADNRTDGTTATGGIGGLLQATTYLAGLSGGGWLVGSIFANNFSTVTQLRDGFDDTAVWQFSNSIFEGPQSHGVDILNTVDYWTTVYDAVANKEDAGYEVTLTDYWGRALSYQLINAENGGPTYTFSSIANDDSFKAADTPMPILVADERSPGTLIVSLNATVYEFNPWEFGSWDPTVYGFIPTEYVGSNFSNGNISDNGKCVRGFDQYGYVMGTSSSLFNQFLLTNISSYDVPDVITNALTSVLEELDDTEEDIAKWEPNPFYKYNADSNPSADDTLLTLVDGGTDLQNIPLHPLIQPNRAVDVIFAVDSSADTTYNYPNGTALRATYDRTMGDISNGTQFPKVPDANTFINLKLNQQPTFFGCDSSEFTNGSSIPPLIVYVPLAPYTAYSNASTFDPSYTDSERNAFIENGLNVATMGNGTVESNWPACAACAVLYRSLEREGHDIPDTCQDCFDKHCWSGETNTTDNGVYEPQPIIALESYDSSGSSMRLGGLAWAWAGAAGLALVL